MNRSTLVYVVMLVIFAVGLWLILRVGASRLRPPEDLAGEWELTPLAGTSSEITALHIEQSGRFFNLSFPARANLRMNIVDESDIALGSARQKIIRLAGAEGQITFSGFSRSDQWRISAVGVVQGNWQGVLINRMYPRTVPTTGPSTPTTSSHAR